MIKEQGTEEEICLEKQFQVESKRMAYKLTIEDDKRLTPEWQESSSPIEEKEDDHPLFLSKDYYGCKLLVNQSRFKFHDKLFRLDKIVLKKI
ncbi:hypothetical protein RCL_jg2527.t1 [Rhizophagus clarus]|uniref:Uncharacterized protein n=1 Tax=Rhizophagus clarus TaxID=94130 RepID=A0A8H3LKK7_9GLOM|nr:hypothetical protein RCL_jg2527.t1 [Rhizophagus clarus]